MEEDLLESVLSKLEELMAALDKLNQQPNKELPPDFEEKMAKLQDAIDEYCKLNDAAIAEVKALIKKDTGKTVQSKEIQAIIENPGKDIGKQERAFLKKTSRLKEKLSRMQAAFEENNTPKEKPKKSGRKGPPKNWQSV